MFKTIEDVILKKMCTGCFACYNECYNNAIKMKVNKEGFYSPVINKSSCIGCSDCCSVCPQITKGKKNYELSYKVYASWSLDDENRLKSSSGGICSEIIKYILDDNGVVFGAAFDDQLTLRHIEINDKNDLVRLRGSKYLQSYVGNSLKKVKKHLSQGKKVLFIGLPCQIAGLNNFIKNKNNLVTVDLLCHGIPSLKIFKNYLQDQFREKSKIKNVIFRYKKDGWSNYSYKVVFDNNEYFTQSKTLNLFHRGFNKNLYLNRTCYECNYNALPRNADISLGDFWCVPSDLHDEKGVSLLICNNSKGENIVGDLIRDGKIYAKAMKINSALVGNPMLSNIYKKEQIKREAFFIDFHEHGFKYIKDKYIGVPQLLQVEGKKIIFFGTGSASINILHELKLDINYFVDNNPEKWNSKINGTIVYSPKTLENEDKNSVIIVVASSYYTDISKQLSKLGFKENINYVDGLRMKKFDNKIYFNI